MGCMLYNPVINCAGAFAASNTAPEAPGAFPMDSLDLCPQNCRLRTKEVAQLKLGLHGLGTRPWMYQSS